MPATEFNDGSSASSSPVKSGFWNILRNHILPAIAPVAASLGSAFGNPEGQQVLEQRREIERQKSFDVPQLAALNEQMDEAPMRKRRLQQETDLGDTQLETQRRALNAATPGSPEYLAALQAEQAQAYIKAPAFKGKSGVPNAPEQLFHYDASGSAIPVTTPGTVGGAMDTEIPETVRKAAAHPLMPNAVPQEIPVGAKMSSNLPEVPTQIPVLASDDNTLRTGGWEIVNGEWRQPVYDSKTNEFKGYAPTGGGTPVGPTAALPRTTERDADQVVQTPTGPVKVTNHSSTTSSREIPGAPPSAISDVASTSAAPTTKPSSSPSPLSAAGAPAPRPPARSGGAARPIIGADGKPIPPKPDSSVTEAYKDYNSAIARQKTMHQNAMDIFAGADPNGQAAISLIANHLGMTAGIQKGMRIQQAMWVEAMSTAPWLDRVLSRFTTVDANGDRVITQPLSGVTLTPGQVKQMVELADEKVGILKEVYGRAYNAQQVGYDPNKVDPPKPAATTGQVKTAADLAKKYNISPSN